MSVEFRTAAELRRAVNDAVEWAAQEAERIADKRSNVGYKSVRYTPESPELEFEGDALHKVKGLPSRKFVAAVRFYPEQIKKIRRIGNSKGHKVFAGGEEYPELEGKKQLVTYQKIDFSACEPGTIISKGALTNIAVGTLNIGAGMVVEQGALPEKIDTLILGEGVKFIKGMNLGRVTKLVVPDREIGSIDRGALPKGCRLIPASQFGSSSTLNETAVRRNASSGTPVIGDPSYGRK